MKQFDTLAYSAISLFNMKQHGGDVASYTGLVAELAPHTTLPLWALYIRCHPSALFTLKVQTLMHTKIMKQLLHMMWLGNKSWCHTSHTGCENLRTRTSEVIYYQWYKQKTPHVALSHLHQLSLKHKCGGEKRPNMWTMTQNCWQQQHNCPNNEFSN